MNPFTQSTVARPLPAHHPDRTWQRRAANSQHQPQQQPQLSQQLEGDHSGASQQTMAAAGSRKRRARLEPQTRIQSGRSGATLGLALCLSCAAAFGGLAAKPAVVASSVAVASALIPRIATAVELNSATVQQLQEVKGIGPKTAALIVEERERGGNFSSLTDLSERVRGIGPKKAAALEGAGLKVAAANAKAAPSGPVPTGRAARAARR